jgi:DNA helicase-2/ATP-dependent DNA helicase PcrA
LKLPSGIVPATVFGNCLHKWLEWLFVEMKKSPDKTFESVEKSIVYFEKALERNKGLLSKNDFERYLNLGKSTVEAYYLQHIGSWNKNVEIELHISKVLIDNIPVNGVIDKITYDENRKPTIIDYKSGTLDSNKLKGIKQNSEGGDYRRQLWLYKLMYENYRPHLPKVDSGIIAYLQKNQEGVFPSETIVFDKEEEMLFKQIIKTVYQKIIDLEFEPGCGKIDCKWCNFAKSNQSIDTFAEEDILDD